MRWCYHSGCKKTSRNVQKKVSISVLCMGRLPMNPNQFGDQRNPSQAHHQSAQNSDLSAGEKINQTEDLSTQSCEEYYTSKAKELDVCYTKHVCHYLKKFNKNLNYRNCRHHHLHCNSSHKRMRVFSGWCQFIHRGVCLINREFYWEFLS